MKRALRKRRVQRQRIRRLRNRISRTRKRLAACDEVKDDEGRRLTLRDIVDDCDTDGLDIEDLVDRVADYLDDLIEPSNPILEWLSDVGIDIAASAAVAVYAGTEARLRRRLARDMATLKRLEARG